MTLADLGLPPLPDALPAPVLDAHTHLDAVEEMSRLDPATALDLAASVGVVGVVQVGCDAPSSVWAADLAAADPRVVACVAIHPNDAARHPEGLDADLETVWRLASGGGRVRGVGETGLDFYRTTDAAGRDTQRRAFRAHIEIANSTGRTLVIHDRDAHDAIAAVLDEVGWPERVVFHCFSGDAAFARRTVGRGAWLSFPGTVTYKANEALRLALDATPIDRLLVETDAPYLTPVPARGRPNSSYLVPHTVRFLAERRGEDLTTLCRALAANAEAAFGGPWVPGGAAS